MDKFHEEINKRNQQRKDNVHPISNDGYSAEVITVDQIKPKQQPWFWQEIIPLDTSTLFAGYGGIGKSQLLIFLAAQTSNGKSFNAGGLTHQLDKGSVIFLSGEDDFEYQLAPKLIALEADQTQIYLLKMMNIQGKKKQLLDLDSHLVLLENTITQINEKGNPVKLIIIDPVQYFTGEMKDYINANVCRFIASLNELAKKYHLAIVMNKHLRKSNSSGDMASAAADSVSGSAAWTTSPRSCWLVHPHPTDHNKILFADLKANLRKKGGKSFCYQIDRCFITDSEGAQIETTKMFWHEKMEDFSADEALNTAKIPPVEQAIRLWIINFLLECNEKPNNGAMFIAAELFKEVIKEGFTKDSYYTTRRKMIDEGIIKEEVIGKGKRVNMIILNDPEIYTQKQ